MGQRNEPSVEEILESIKKVIAREAGETRPRTADEIEARPHPLTAPLTEMAGPAANGGPSDEVLELSDADMMTGREEGERAPRSSATDSAQDRPSGSNENSVDHPHGATAPQAVADGGADSGSDPGALTSSAEQGPAAANGCNEEEAPLTSEAVRESMRRSFAALSMLAEPGSNALPGGARETTIEQLVREMLHPMLAQWLEAHLPAMVEQMVEAEIARISRKRD